MSGCDCTPDAHGHLSSCATKQPPSDESPTLSVECACGARSRRPGLDMRPFTEAGWGWITGRGWTCPTCYNARGADTSTDITEEWLRSVGFKWHQLDRQPSKHWVLWLGGVVGDATFEDLGIELADGAFRTASGERDAWFCWLRADYAGRYTRFLHVRHVRHQHDVIALFEGLTCLPWRPENHIGGAAWTQARADQYRQDSAARLDRALVQKIAWSGESRDDSKGRALPEHRDAYEPDREAGKR